MKQKYETKIYNNNQEITDKDELIKTNMRADIYKNGIKIKEYILVVTGDCNGTGTVNVSDLTSLMMSIAEEKATNNKNEAKILKNAFMLSVDLNNNERLNVADITMLTMNIAKQK